MSLVSLNKLAIACAVILIAGCRTTSLSDERKDIQSVLNVPVEMEDDTPFVVPQNIQQKMMPSTLNSQSPVLQKRFDISANNVDVKSFFSSLVEETPFSVIFHNDLSGALSLELKQVTLDEVLEAVSQTYDYHIEKSGRILQVSPATISTETFSFNYLLIKRNGTSQTSISSGGITQNDNSNNLNNRNSSSNSSSTRNSDSNGSSSKTNSTNSVNGTFIESQTETDYWKELESTLSSLIQGEGKLVVLSPQAGLVTVKGYPKDVALVKAFLSRSEENLQRQVILEARIIEVTLSDGYQQGIEWQRLLSNVGAKNNITNTRFEYSDSNPESAFSGVSLSNVISNTLGGVTSLSFANTNFEGVVNLLSTQGDVNVLSSPRITALNNQKAVIKVGNDEYFVTDVSSSNTITGVSSVSTPEIELTPFFSGIALDVTPQINDEGQVLLHVHPSVIDVVEQQKTIEIQEALYQLPLANSSIRETDTMIKAASGDIVVIGGLMSSRTTENESKVPLLGSIPLVGELFTNRQESIEKTELIILIKPVVVTGKGTWRDQLKKSKALLDKWYK